MEGKQYRNAYCYYKDIQLPDIKCHPYWKPTTDKSCIKTKGCPPTWVIMFGPVSYIQVKYNFYHVIATTLVQYKMCESGSSEVHAMP